MDSESMRLGDASQMCRSPGRTKRATQFKVLGKENTWFVEGKLKTQGQEAGGNEL